MDNTVNDLQEYEVIPNTPVTLTIIIGYTNPGGSSIEWKGNDITPPGGEVQNLVIGGPGQDLSNTILDCITWVKDTNQATNITSVIYQFIGGTEQKEFPYSCSVPPGGQAQFLITFRFVSGGDQPNVVS